jgi:hypothetical protein
MYVLIPASNAPPVALNMPVEYPRMADDAFRNTDPPLPPPPPYTYEFVCAMQLDPAAPFDVTLPLMDTNSVTVKTIAPPPEPPSAFGLSQYPGLPDKPSVTGAKADPYT